MDNYGAMSLFNKFVLEYAPIHNGKHTISQDRLNEFIDECGRYLGKNNIVVDVIDGYTYVILTQNGRGSRRLSACAFTVE